MRGKRLLLALGLVTSASSAGAASDLMSIYREARGSDPIFQQAIATLKASEEAVPQARAGLLPDIGAQGSFDRISEESDFDATPGSPDSDDDYNSVQYGIQLTQALFRYSTYKSLDQAQANVASAQAQFAFAEQDLMLRVSERYFAVLDAQAELAAARATQKAFERQLEQARQRFEVGLTARTDVEEAKAEFDLARADVIQQENNLQIAREQLRVLIGRIPGKLATLEEQIDFSPPQPTVLDAWQRRAEEQNWQLTAARKAAEAAMINIDVQRGGHYPTLDATAGYNVQDDSGGAGSTFGGASSSGGIETDQFSVGVQLNVPIYSGGLTSSRVREAQYRYTEAREILTESRRTVLRNTAEAYWGVGSALQRVQALDQARTSTRAALEATQAGFDVGTRTIVDVLDAQQRVFEAQRDYQQARHNYLINTLRLKQAAGILSDEDLKAINTLLKPQSEDEIDSG